MPQPAPAKPADLTARVAVHPSPLIRPVPPFLFSVPTGWVLEDAAGALVVARTEQQVDGFWINAILTSQRIARTTDLEQAARASWARVQRSSPGATVTMERLARFGGTAVYLRGVELTAPRSGRPLAQLHALLLAPAPPEGRTVDLFELVATSPREHMERYGADVVELVGSFRFLSAA